MHSTLNRFFQKKAFLMNNRKRDHSKRIADKRTFPKIGTQKIANSSSISSIKKNPYASNRKGPFSRADHFRDRPSTSQVPMYKEEMPQARANVSRMLGNQIKIEINRN